MSKWISALTGALLFFIVACEDSGASAPDPLKPVEVCQKVGQRCKLSQNKLGICDSLDGGERRGELVCNDQH